MPTAQLARAKVANFIERETANDRVGARQLDSRFPRRALPVGLVNLGQTSRRTLLQ